MGNMQKRVLSFVLALLMICSLLPLSGITAQAATVNYVYNGQYIYNWGSRGTTATFMSPNAIAFYEDNNVTLDELSMLSGSATTGGVPSSALYQRLKTLMSSNHSYKTSYDATKDLYKYTDCQNSGGKISSFYSGNAIGPGWGEGGSWNREHTWPNSKGLGGQDENDIMMLRPTSTSENSSRGNTAYGKSSGYYNPNSVSNGTYNLHGDVARVVLYTYVRWGNTSYMWGQSGVMESKEVLLQWMEEDPVDTWELGRNDAVEAITGTRNVFVDYPELAFVMFGEEIPANYQSPSGGISTSVSYQIDASTNNTAWGTVSVSGRTITASPATGYEVVGYDVLSGTATVSRTGNQFVVSASADVSIRINFAEKVALPTVSQLQTGDQVVIYAPAYNKALSSDTVATHYLAGVDIAEANGELTGYGTSAVWTVTANSDNTYSFSYSGQKLGMADEYSSMKLGEAHDKWQLTGLGGSLYNIKNTVRGNYMEWYASKDNWSTYTANNPTTDDQFQLSIYVIGKGVLTGEGAAPDQPDTPDTPPATNQPSAALKDGDQVVIFAPAYNKALTSETVATHYLAGADITVSDNAVTGYGNTAVWTVSDNGDGTYSFSYSGQKLGMADEYSSMKLGEEHDKWQLISLGGSLYNVKNTVRGNYMEWYASKDNWSTYTNPSDNQFQLSFYVIGEGIVTETGTSNPDPNPNPNPNPNPDPETPPATNDGILELTVDTLGLESDTYYTGAATVEGIELDLTQIGNYGSGIQMRDKEEKTSILFNKTPLSGKITKIELVFNSGKTTYDNADAVIFSFGAAQDNLTYTTKLSTVAGTYTYTITPEGDNTFFRIEHDLGYTFYWDSIKVYYEATEPAPDPTEQLAAPVVEGTNDITGRGKLTWSAVPGADAYRIFCGDQYGSRFHELDTTTQLQYVEDFSEVGDIYVYIVQAIDLDDETRSSEYSNDVEILTKCAAPTVTVQADSGKPVLTWEKVDGAKKYTVYRATSENGKYSKLGTTTKLSYTDKKAKIGNTYYYKVIANASKSKCNSEYSNIVCCNVTCAAPSLTFKIDTPTGKPVLSWKKISGAVGYRIFRQLPGETMELLAETTSTSYKDLTAPADAECLYQVQAVGKTSALDSNYSAVAVVITGIAQPKVTGSIDSLGRPVITWDAVDGALWYEVYRSTKSSKGYTLMATLEDGTSYTDTSATAGKTYYYKVAAVGEITEGTVSSYVKLTGKCAAPVASAALDEISGKPVITWEKINGAKKYTVYRATSEDGKYSKVGTTKSLSYTDSKAVPGNTYYYKVVANGSSSKYNSIYSQATEGITAYAAQPKVTLKNDSKGRILVSWKKVSEAEKYYVVYVDVTELEDESELTEQYILDNLQYVEVSKKKTGITLTQAELGRAYMIMVIAVPKNEEYFSLPSTPDYAAYTCAAPKIKGKYIMGYNCGTWKDVEGAEYYGIYRSTSKNGEYVFLGYIEGDPSFADLSAQPGKTYYYKVTACTEYTESEFSNIIKMKTKK